MRITKRSKTRLDSAICLMVRHPLPAFVTLAAGDIRSGAGCLRGSSSGGFIVRLFRCPRCHSMTKKPNLKPTLQDAELEDDGLSRLEVQ